MAFLGHAHLVRLKSPATNLNSPRSSSNLRLIETSNVTSTSTIAYNAYPVILQPEIQEVVVNLRILLCSVERVRSGQHHVVAAI